jgi:alpha-galactosidase
MSRNLHRLFRNHLSTSKFTHTPRPPLLNNWEATYFDFTAKSLLPIAEKAADLGVKLFVMDDGWFGRGKNARTNDHHGLGDWVTNPDIFSDGLGAFVSKVTDLRDGTMRFGIWVEPEMVNPKSDLYEAHPDWVLHATDHDRTTQRNQLVLNLALTSVQDYIIDILDKLLSSAKISYVKWDKNRMIHETPSPSTIHAYMLGLYRVLDTLTTRYPDVLWEGCASGGGRFDPGILYYFPQTWTSDNTDALDRLSIQFGTTLAYPASAMGCHISAVPNHQTHRVTPLEFRAHVAMMGGSFGFELDPNALSAEEQTAIPELIKLAERVNPLVITGEMYRLNLPTESNWPAAMYIAQNGSEAVVLAYQARATMLQGTPALRLQGLAGEREYEVDCQGEKRAYSGATLMGTGLKLWFEGDYQSQVIFIVRK